MHQWVKRPRRRRPDLDSSRLGLFLSSDSLPLRSLQVITCGEVSAAGPRLRVSDIRSPQCQFCSNAIDLCLDLFLISPHLSEQ